MIIRACEYNPYIHTSIKVTQKTNIHTPISWILTITVVLVSMHIKQTLFKLLIERPVHSGEGNVPDNGSWDARPEAVAPSQTVVRYLLENVPNTLIFFICTLLFECFH